MKKVDGKWIYDEEDEAVIEMGARTRIRADEMREERESARACPRCGKPKNQGEHGEGKCQPTAPAVKCPRCGKPKDQGEHGKGKCEKIFRVY